MNRNLYPIVLAVALALVAPATPALSVTTPPAATDDEVGTLATTIMSKLVAGDHAAAIARIHEPPAWDKARVAEDRRAVTEDFAALLKDFGKISSPRVASSITFYELQLAGGDVDYWQSLPNHGVDARVSYNVDFSKAGPGVVAISFTRVSGDWHLRSISLGLERSRPDSKETMMKIGRVFLGRADPKMSRDQIDAALEETFSAEEP